MLVLSRKVDESIVIGEDIEIKVLSVKGEQVKIGIKAPKNVKIYRKEVYDAIQQENIKAVVDVGAGQIEDIMPVFETENKKKEPVSSSG